MTSYESSDAQLLAAIAADIEDLHQVAARIRARRGELVLADQPVAPVAQITSAVPPVLPVVEQRARQTTVTVTPVPLTGDEDWVFDNVGAERRAHRASLMKKFALVLGCVTVAGGLLVGVIMIITLVMSALANAAVVAAPSIGGILLVVVVILVLSRLSSRGGGGGGFSGTFTGRMH